MKLLDYFRTKNKGSAAIAKERLQIIVAHERDGDGNNPEYLSQLQADIVEVIRKYVKIEKDDVSVSLDTSDNYSILELNITLPPA
jgi:cell division topological specificity factor